ncbi:MAG: response regulator [Kiritimatiellales bacterium]
MPRILIVDDAPSFLLMLSTLLVDRGYEVTSATNGEEALRILQTEPFDLMISDINMEPINGLELLRKAKESYAKMKVILLTAYETHYSFGEAERAGAFAYLPKPFRNPVLFQTVRRALESSDVVA